MTNAWFDRHIGKTEDKRLLIQLKAKAVQPPPETFDVEWCQTAPSALERRVIKAVRRAVGRECDRLGVSRPATTNDLVHIVRAEVCPAVIGLNLDGRVRLRHVYLRGSLPGDRLLNITLHEFSHAVSYLMVESVRRQPRFDPRDPWNGSDFRPRRVGLEFTAYRRSGLLETYTAVNEAVTEIMAHQVGKWLLADSDTGLDPGQCRKASRHWNYQAAVCLVDALIRKLGPAFGGIEAARDQLLRDYLIGSAVFLRELNRRLPGVARILATMPAGRSDVAAAAKTLGLKRVHARVSASDENY